MLRKQVFLLVLAWVLTVLHAEPVRADCSALEALISGDGSAQGLNVRDAMEACGDPSVLGLIYNRDAAETAAPVNDVIQIAGYWVNDYWIHVALGIAVPVIETLEIARDGRLERRALRFYDAALNRHIDDPSLEMALPDYSPLLAEGTATRDTDGRVRVIGLMQHDYIADALQRERSPQDHQAQVQTAVVSMPDFTQPFDVTKTENMLVIRDASGQVRTYRRFDRQDVERIHQLILAANISAARNWPCLRDRMFAGGAERAALRAAGDTALKIAAAQLALLRLTAEANNAALKQPELTGRPDPDAMKAAVDKIRTLYTSEEGQRFIEQVEASPPFGCP